MSIAADDEISGADLWKAYDYYKQFGYLHPEEIEFAVTVTKLRHREKEQFQFISVNFYEPSKIEMVRCAKEAEKNGDHRPPKRIAVVGSTSLALNETYYDYVVLPPDLLTDEEPNFERQATRQSSTSFSGPSDGSVVHYVGTTTNKARAVEAPTYASLTGTGESPTEENDAVKDDIIPTQVIFEDVQAGMSPEEYVFVEKYCRSFQPLIDTIKKRGLNPEFLVADAWCVGHTGPECSPKERMAWPSVYYFDPSVDDFPYSRPIEGIDMRISLTRRTVVSYSDEEFLKFPVPGSFDAPRSQYIRRKEDQRTGLKPISITQPEGPSFHVEPGTQRVTWQGWSMQVGFNYREGLVMYGVCYGQQHYSGTPDTTASTAAAATAGEGVHNKDNDKGKKNREVNWRPILHRASYVEMVVPYGDPRFPHNMKMAFDAGEDGLGRNANSLRRGCDCLGHIHYFDGHMVSDSGEVSTVQNAICLHEEDAGLGWKHTDWRDEVPHVRRSRRLVISFICTVANYEYGFYYYFYLNGNIEFEVKLTGVLSTGALSYEEMELISPPTTAPLPAETAPLPVVPPSLPGGGAMPPSSGETGGGSVSSALVSVPTSHNPVGKVRGRKYGTRLGGALYAPVHQHFFIVKMDFAVDGARNSISEFNVEVEPEGEDNPLSNGFYFTETPLETEQAAIRDSSAQTARFWKIKNTKLYNRLGEHPSYKLMPGSQGGTHPFAASLTSPNAALRRSQFLAHELWVTPARSGEQFPGGNFPNQNPGLVGLPLWVQENRNLKDEELVVWYIFGVTHLPRLEDWPVMPVEHTGFHLKPVGFFDFSPVMDLPPLKEKLTNDVDAEEQNGGETKNNNNSSGKCCANKG